MEKVTLTILQNTLIIPSVFEMKLEGNMGAISRPGQFVNIALPNLYLRRPISVSDCDGKSYLSLLYKVVGKGTEQMSQMLPGQTLEVLTGLGNGFSVEATQQAALLLGGGIGIAPLYGLAKALKAKGKEVTVVLGFNRADEVFYEKKFQQLGAQVYVATMDGSCGTKGFVTDVLQQYSPQADYFYACGPMPMLRALRTLDLSGELSLEARMGCGFGICMGCTIQTTDGSKRVCKEGPVFPKEQIIW